MSATDGGERWARCPLCDGHRFSRYGERGEYHLVTCRSCGLVFVHERMPEGFLRELYTGQSCERYVKQGPDPLARCRTVLRQIQKLGLPGKRALDVGCGSGLFLEVAGQRGFEAVGIEADPHRVQWCTSRGLEVLHGTLPDRRLRPGSFDLVWISHVIEHVHTSRQFMHEAVRLTAPGGLLCVLTPNIKNVAARICRCHHRSVIPPAHLTYWSARPLQFLARQFGLVPLRLYSSGGAWDLKEILAYLLRLRFLRRAPATLPMTPFVEGKGKAARSLYSAVLRLSRLVATLMERIGGEELVGIFRRPLRARSGDAQWV